MSSGNDNIKKDQGAIKLEEIRLNKPQEVIETPEEYNALIALEQLRKIAQDSLRRAGLILTSTNPVIWTGDEILMNAGGIPANLQLLLLQNEATSSRTIRLVMQGTVGAPNPTLFNQISLDDGEVLYLQLNRETILAEAAASVDGTVIIENQVNGGSVVSGKTALRSAAAKNTGVPFLSSPIGGNSDTFNIPIAICLHRTIGPDTFKDIWWIPHGIRWPAGTSSVIGAVIVEGQDVYPNLFARNELEFDQAISQLSANGGVLVIADTFSLSQQYLVPSNTKILGRKGAHTLIFGPGSGLTLNENVEIRDLHMLASADHSNFMINCDAEYSVVQDCRFDVSASVNSTAIRFNKKNNLAIRNIFIGTEGDQITLNFDPGDWDTHQDDPTNAAWQSVVWSPELEKFVAVASSGDELVMTSPDGETWTEQVASATSAWKSVAWSPSLNLFAAVAEGGTDRIMTSPDGETWTSRFAPIESQWQSITWSEELGKFVVVSDFTGNLFVTGDIDQDFLDSATQKPPLNERLHLIEPQPDGKIILGGRFTHYQAPRVESISITSAGTLTINTYAPHELSNASNVSFEIHGSTLDTDFVGVYNNVDIVVLSPNSFELQNTGLNPGDIPDFTWPGFGSLPSGGDVYIQPNDRTGIIRLNADGTIDEDFSNNIGAKMAGNNVFGGILQPDGKVIFSTTGNPAYNDAPLIRLEADGTTDLTFITNTGGFAQLSGLPGENAFALQSDGKILTGNVKTSLTNEAATGFSSYGMTRFNANGSGDKPFNDNLEFISGNLVAAIAVQEDGKILAGGTFTDYGGEPGRNHLLRLNSDGTVDEAFCVEAVDGHIPGQIWDIKIQPDGKIIVAGGFSQYKINGKQRIFRLNPDGTHDSSFADNTNFVGFGIIYSIQLLPDGRVVCGGTMVSYDGEIGRDQVVVLNPDGTLDAFLTDVLSLNKFTGFGYPSVLRLRNNSQLLIGGQFTEYNSDSDIRYFAPVFLRDSEQVRVLNSTDGINWLDYAAAEENSWKSVTWSPELEKFVAVASFGTNRVMTSEDGENWIGHSADDNSWFSVTWSPELEKFVAVGIDGVNNQVMTSDDGEIWNTYNAANNNSWRSVVWSAEAESFVAVASSGTNRVMVSPDGETWTAYPSGNESNAWTSITWSAELEKFVAVAESGTDKAMTNELGTVTIPTGSTGIDYQDEDNADVDSVFID